MATRTTLPHWRNTSGRITVPNWTPLPSATNRIGSRITTRTQKLPTTPPIWPIGMTLPEPSSLPFQTPNFPAPTPARIIPLWTQRFADDEKNSGILAAILQHDYVGQSAKGVSVPTAIDAMLSPDWVTVNY